MSTAVRWAGYVIDLRGAEPAALKRLLAKAFAEGIRITMLPDGSAIATHPEGGRHYLLTPDGRCQCAAATFGRLCKHRALWGYLRAITESS